MKSTILSDFSRVILSPKDPSYTGMLNTLHKTFVAKKGENYDIFDHFTLNSDLLDFYKSLKFSHSLHLFTTDVIQDHPRIRPILDSVFENIFAAKDFGLSKEDSQAYTFIVNKIGRKPNEIIYIDDNLKNVKAARVAGLNVLLFKGDTQATISEVKKLLQILDS